MARTYLQPGGTLTLIAPGAVKSGDIVIIGGIAGVAQTDADVGTEVEVQVEGVHVLPKTTPEVINAGAAAFWVVATKKVSGVADANFPLGVVTESAGTDVASVYVRLGYSNTALAAALAALDARVVVLENA